MKYSEQFRIRNDQVRNDCFRCGDVIVNSHQKGKYCKPCRPIAIREYQREYYNDKTRASI